MKWQTGNNWQATRHQRHDSETWRPTIQTLVLFTERQKGHKSEVIIAFHTCQWRKEWKGTWWSPHLLHALTWSAENPVGKETTNTVETISSHDNFFCVHRFTSGWHFGMAVGTKAAVQINPMWLAEMIPTEMGWTEIEHYCNPMESLTPPYGRETFSKDVMAQGDKAICCQDCESTCGTTKIISLSEDKKKCIYLFSISLGREPGHLEDLEIKI